MFSFFNLYILRNCCPVDKASTSSDSAAWQVLCFRRRTLATLATNVLACLRSSEWALHQTNEPSTGLVACIAIVICLQVPGARQGDELAVKRRASALAAATGLGCEDESATVERQCSNKCALRASNVGLCERCWYSAQAIMMIWPTITRLCVCLSTALICWKSP